MQAVFEYTKGMRKDISTYCPGCTHGIAHRIIMEVLDESNEFDLGNTIGIAPIGCSIISHQYMNIDMIEAPHGRAPAVATGVKRVHPDAMVFSYQGDGDLASIGTAEIVHAAHRGEKICTFFINNAIYGMTGGQMAPTTLIGQKTTTSINGRTVEQAGMPLRMCELISTIDGAVYVERVSLHSAAEVRKAKKAVQRAFEIQKKGLGFAFVEMISNCPTNWGLNPVESLEWMKSAMIPYYPLKQFKCPEEVSK